MAKKNVLTQSKKKKAMEMAQGGRFDEAKKILQEVCRIDRMDADAWFALGVISGKLENAIDAIENFRRAIAFRPGHALSHFNLGIALHGQGKLEDAMNAFREALKIEPHRAEMYGSLGHTLLMLGRMEEAIASFRRQLALNPQDAKAQASLGSALHVTGYLEEAVTCYRKALSLQDGHAMLYDNLGSALCEQGRYDEAMTSHRRSIELEPANAQAHSNLLLTLHYVPAVDPGQGLAEHLRWAQTHSRCASRVGYANDRSPERRLRIGYVSADFRAHSVASFFEPLLSNHDSMVVETFCYSRTVRPDAVTERLRGKADQWRDIAGLAGEEVAEIIRGDSIDILIDLAGHTAGSGLKIFSCKPAPIQVTYLGYPATTGLSEIDYRFADTWVDPEGEDKFYTEKLIRLPGGFLCYQPLADSPHVAPLPALEMGHVTFGSFNNLAKVNPMVVALWSDLLKMIPGARLLIKNPSLTDPATCERYYGLFEERGVPRERVELLGRTATQAEHLAMYRRLDIALDTFPYNGTTTTCEAMWMGVPVITLAGKAHAGRVGVSLLTNAGLSEWIAESPEQYLSIAVAMAKDLTSLVTLRTGLRERMSTSPLCDGKRFAQKVEHAYRDMWTRWCNS